MNFGRRTDGPSRATPIGEAAHEQAVAGLRAQLRAQPAGAPIRLAKSTSNLFRPRQAAGSAGLDVSALGSVIDIDPRARTAQVQGMATYETIVDATLPHALMPKVVPQLRTITLGGAVTGLGIESTSYRNGLPHESVVDLDILTGDGELITASRSQHADLFRGFPNSYGSLGYSVRLRVELEPVQPYVRLRNLRFQSITALIDAMTEAITGSYAGEPVDFVDGVAFERDDLVLVLGQQVAEAAQPSEYLTHPYYLSLRQRTEDHLSIHDYLWRWDTDWFWCSKALGVQKPWLRRLIPNRYLRSETYQKIIRFENRHGVMAALDARRGKPARERVVQDVEVPLGRTADFLDWFLDTIPMRPIWLCPLAVHERDAGDVPWPLYPMRTGEPYVNVGFWGTVEIAADGHDGDTNKLIERVVADHDGHKSLYSDAYYSRADFARMYGGDAYAGLKQQYDPDGRLPDLYTKVVERR